MITQLDVLRGSTFPALVFKLFLSMILAGAIGLERERKRRPAGLRTYILVCLGSSLTVILSQYENTLIHTLWQSGKNAMDLKVDVSRFGAQVINGIGFLGAGTIIVTGRHEVKGLTTAAGLWASGCLGLVIGAGFFEAAFTGFVLIVLSSMVLPVIEDFLRDHASNMNVYIEFSSIENVRNIVKYLRLHNISIYEIDLEKGHRKRGVTPRAIVLLGLSGGMNHNKVLSDLSQLDCIDLIEEI